MDPCDENKQASQEIKIDSTTKKNIIKKLDVTEYIQTDDSQSTNTSTTGSFRSIPNQNLLLTTNVNEIKMKTESNNDNTNNNNNNLSSSTIVNSDLMKINVMNDDNYFEYEDDYENSWNNDKLIDENFNLNFDINQININLIGKCQHSSSSSSSGSSSNSTSVSNSRFGSGRSRVSVNLNNNNNKSDSSNLIPDNKTPTNSSQIVKCFIKNLNNNKKKSSSSTSSSNSSSSTPKQTEEKIHHKNHSNDNKYLFFVQKINQVNVDGFEWDLV